jgi:TRAP-type C4-dicarboxylate transport system permease small subunit
MRSSAAATSSLNQPDEPLIANPEVEEARRGNASRRAATLIRAPFVAAAFVAGWAAQALLVVAIAVAVGNVVRRYLLNEPWPWADEAATLAVSSLVFLVLPYLEIGDANLRITFLERRLGTRRGLPLVVVRWAATLFVNGYLAYTAISVVRQNRDLETMTPSLGFPLWVLYATLPIGLGGAALCRLVLGAHVVRDRLLADEDSA